MRAAGGVLGVSPVVQLDYPDGRLAEADPTVVDALLDPYVKDAELVVVFEPSGVTGHPDHQAATAAGERAAARFGIPILEWGLAPHVAARLRDELAAPFVALGNGLDGVTDVTVDRGRQRAAIACHPSQATGNRVLERRLVLQGDRERVRFLCAPSALP